MEGTGFTLCATFLCILMVFSSAAENVPVEYQRSGLCDFTQECVYKYSTTQTNYGEKDRERLSLSTDVNWHCESSGMFGSQPANEYCFTLSNTIINVSTDTGTNSTLNYTSVGQNDTAEFLENELKEEFCYVQTSDGQIVAVHYGVKDNYEVINIKRSISSAFQANFDRKKATIIESDVGSTHVSHYKYDKTSEKVTSFTREVVTDDLIKMSGEATKDSVVYLKQEKSIFVKKILLSSHGILKIKLDFGKRFNDSDNDSDGLDNNADQEEGDDFSSGKSAEPIKPSSDEGSIDDDKDFNFGKEFEANGSYVIQKAFCKQRTRRDIVFTDLSAASVEKSTLMAIIDSTKFDRYRIKKIRDTISSVPGLIENLRKNPNDTQSVHSLQHLLMLEAQHGALPGYIPAVNQIVEYYIKIQWSKKPQDVEIKKLIYSFLAADGSPQSQRILGSLVTRSLSEEERNALLHQVVHLAKAEAELIDTIINIKPSNEDDLLLVLGALARNNDLAIQRKVVHELVERLNEAKSARNGSETVVTLNYALGNTGSHLAVEALLSSLSYDDIDIQTSVIRSLDVHLDQPVVQKALIVLLNTTIEDAVLEETLRTLKAGFNNKLLENPNAELIYSLVHAAIRLQNPTLYELLTQYLMLVGNDDALKGVDIIMQQHSYEETKDEDSRIKRGWDTTSSSYYNLIGSYYQRSRDIINYPKYKSFLLWRHYGLSALNCRASAGTFIGTYNSGSTRRFKIFTKAVAEGHVLGYNFNIAELEYNTYSYGSSLYRKIYVKLGSSVRTNSNIRYDLSCRSSRGNLWDTSATVFYRSISYFVFVGTINFYVRGTVSTRGDAGICMCPQYLSACAIIKPSLSLSVTGGASVNLASLVRGGIDVTTQFTYYLEPKACIQASSSFSTDICLQLHHGYPSYVYIEPWYQTRTISRWRITWGRRRAWRTKSWRLSDSRYALWDSCTPYIRPCNP